MNLVRLRATAAAAVLAFAATTASLAHAQTPAAPVDLASHTAGAWGFDLAGRDVAARPQDNFFEYANGGFLKKTEIPADQVWWGVYPAQRDLSLARVRATLEEAAKTAPVQPAPGDIKGKLGAQYKAFMDEGRIDALGATPLAGDLAAIKAAKDKSAIAHLMGVGSKSFQGSLFGGGVGADDKDTTKYAFFMDVGGLYMPNRDYYLDPRFADKKAAYEVYVGKMLTLVGWADPAKSAKDIVAFETELAQASWTLAERRDPQKVYNPYTPAELAAYAPGFDFPAYFAGADMTSVNRVIFAQNTAAPKFAAIYAKTPVETLQAYMAFNLTASAAPYLSKAFVDTRFDFVGKTLSGQPQITDRWKRGVNSVETTLGEGIGEVYVAKYFTPEAKAGMTALVENLRAAYVVRIKNLAWMSPETKTKALQKLAAYDIQIGYPSKWRDYSALTIRSDDLYGNMQRGAAWQWAFDMAKLGKPMDKEEWGMTPQTVNAYNSPNFVQVVFPAAILQPPTYDLKADPAVNYGAIGAVIGHEMGHGFDDSGRQYDNHGELVDWWTAADAERFKASTKALGAKYDAFEMEPGAFVKGDQTMGENVADLAGILVALDAYHKSLGGKPAPVLDGLTGDQRFFLGYAQYYRTKYRPDFAKQILVSDVHSPDIARVNVILPNVDGFYDAFGVKPGDKMYVPPEQRVRIW